MQDEPTTSAPGADGRHAFDFEFGEWRTSLSLLPAPLSGSAAWAEYEGTSRVIPIWGGAANLVELVADGPRGHLEALALRLYDPATESWTLIFANSRSGAVSPPMRGRFLDGRGEFFSDEELDGRPIRVRFLITPNGADECRFEQAFSADGGATWEPNWRAVDTRIAGAGDDPDRS
jgi:hypothetical protein